MKMLESKDGFPVVYCENAAEWRNWLAQYHQQEKNVWLVIYRKNGPTPSVQTDEAIDEALCFGWIDSKPNKRDAESFFLFFSQRNPKSKWSGVNKRKVEKLLAEGKMAPAGLAMVELAKQTGTWTALDEATNLVIPPDLEQALRSFPNAEANFLAFPPSTRRGILEWILNAKQPETRQKRVMETATLAERNERANQYVRKPGN